jgi:hypothetical protein
VSLVLRPKPKLAVVRDIPFVANLADRRIVETVIVPVLRLFV